MIRMIPSGLDDLEGKGVGAEGGQRRMIRMIPSGLEFVEGGGEGAAESRVFFYDNAFGREKSVVFE